MQIMLTKVKLARLKLGFRQWDVARQVGISESSLSKIETGRTQLSTDFATRLAEVLNVGVEDIQEDS